MDRRDFLIKGSLSLMAVTLLGKGVYAISPGPDTISCCLPTTSDILGPFYRANAPFRSDLTVPNEQGDLLQYKGYVLGPDCLPIEGAIVEVWQADYLGAYDNSSPDFNYRGRQQTPADGSFSFIGVEPGRYLNGSQYRPQHIHFRVTAPGYTELVTQLYFQNDPYITTDPWASSPDAQERIVAIDYTGTIATANFHILLNAVTGLAENELQVPVKVLQNPFASELGFFSAAEQLINFELFNAVGTLVARQYDINQNSLQVHLGHLPRAVYFARLQTLSNIYVLQVVKG